MRSTENHSETTNTECIPPIYHLYITCMPCVYNVIRNETNSIYIARQILSFNSNNVKKELIAAPPINPIIPKKMIEFQIFICISSYSS